MAALPPDIVCFYTDLGRPYYPLLKTMTDSARAVMKGSRLVLVSPNASKSVRALFDITFPLDVEPTWDKLCLHKANVFMSWMLGAKRDTIFIDPDVEFKRVPDFGNDCDVAVSWRPVRADQPVNLGMLYAKPGHPDFWNRYGQIVAYLPKQLHSWWCDQLGFSILLGVDHEEWKPFRILDANVKAIPFDLMCSHPERARPDAWSIHLKGKRKGEGWEAYYGEKSHKSASG